MKRIGQTDKGEIIVRMTRDEYHQFENLASAVEGVPISELLVGQQYHLVTEVDLSSTFGAINAYATTRLTLNSLKELVAEAIIAINREGKAK